MKKIIRYNLEIFTGIMLLFCVITALFWKEMSLARKLAAGYMLLYVMHEWEEGRLPGGFYDLFFGRIGAEVKGDRYAMHVPAAVMIIISRFSLGSLTAYICFSFPRSDFRYSKDSSIPSE